MPTRVNVADRLAEQATQLPNILAVVCPKKFSPGWPSNCVGKSGTSYASITFAELDAEANRLARGLVAYGIGPGKRIVLLVPPGIEFVALVFALLRTGATAVLIDAGMGRKHILNCLAEVRPDGFVGIPKAQAVRTLFRRRFPQAKLNVTVGKRWFWGGTTLDKIRKLGEGDTTLPDTRANDPAAVIFTSGSTGPPKGVLYTQQMFDTQVEEIQKVYRLAPGGIDLSCFPLFGLFNSAMGITTVLPEMDFSRPASANPEKLLVAADDWKITQSFASPAVWDKLSRFCQAHDIRVVSLQKVFSCGAPVPAKLLRSTIKQVAPGAEMHTPYGATECLPIATIEAQEVLSSTANQTDQGAGICVGRKFDSVDWMVVRISDGPIASISDVEEMPIGEVGELIVKGPQASPKYVTTTAANETSKIADSEESDMVWHRIGDVGYLDVEGRFWYCGRKAHRVETTEGTLFTIPCEAQLNLHPHVVRSALVGVGAVGNQQACVVFEPSSKQWEKSRIDQVHVDELLKEVRAEAEKILKPHPIGGVWGIPGRLPVDVRHNAKINREELAHWASEKIKSTE